MDATDGIVTKLPLSEELADLLSASRRVRQQIARKRQTQYLAKQLRRLDEDELDALRGVFEVDQSQIRRETARLHRLEALRDQLIAGGDEALAALLDEHPQADRNHLRQLQRQAARERQQATTPRASRELFRYLRELLAATASTDADAIAEDDVAGAGSGDFDET